VTSGMTARPGVPLAAFTTFRVGGPAAAFVEAGTAAEIISVTAECDRAGQDLLILAGGSNLLISDAGFPGTVLRLVGRGVRITRGADRVRLLVAAGEPWDEVVARALAEGLAGIEALSGIPGSAGATPIQNVGAYGQEVADVIAAVHVWDRHDHVEAVLAPPECAFGYRDSAFKRSRRYVVTAVEFGLVAGSLGAPVRYAELARALGVEIGDRAPALEVRAAVLELRRSKGMVLDPADHDTWSAGSFFTNPVLEAATAADLPAGAPRFEAPEGRIKTSAAWLIEQAGFAKGYGSGPARLSTKHTLALTNRGDARAADLLALAREIRVGVAARFGILLEHEPMLVGLTL
jgi:UDP-N-acetylmuramate dehydrogenase